MICMAACLNVHCLPTSLFKITPCALTATVPRAEGRTQARPEEPRYEEEGHSSAACPPCRGLAAPDGPQPSASGAAARDTEQKASWQKAVGWEPISSTSQLQPEKLGPPGMGGRSIQAGTGEFCHEAVTGYGEKREALGQPRASLASHRAFACSLLGLLLMQEETQSLCVLLVLDLE